MVAACGNDVHEAGPTGGAAGNGSGGSGAGGSVANSWTSAPGQTSYLVVDGYAGAEGSYTLSVDCACR
jgi:hypothetical protein